MAYRATLSRVETYFDHSATAAWAALTSDAPVSRIRASVRRGRDAMRAQMLGRLPADLSGARVLDAGCGTGQMTQELLRRGAEVLAVDISPRLVALAEQRLPADLAGRVRWHAGDMLDPALGPVDHVLAMDSLLYYRCADVARALADLGSRCSGKLVFTLAPRTPLLTLMWHAGQLFPRADRSPTIVPQSPAALARALRAAGAPGDLRALERISSGFYISQAMEYAPC